MRILYINHATDAFADWLSVPEQITVGDLLDIRHADSVGVTIRVNRAEADLERVLQEGDRVVIVPQKIAAA